MYICMYVCMYLFMYVCIYVCIYVCMYVCMHNMYECMYVCIACMYMHTCACMYLQLLIYFVIFTIISMFIKHLSRWLIFSCYSWIIIINVLLKYLGDY